MMEGFQSFILFQYFVVQLFHDFRYVIIDHFIINLLSFIINNHIHINSSISKEMALKKIIKIRHGENTFNCKIQGLKYPGLMEKLSQMCKVPIKGLISSTNNKSVNSINELQQILSQNPREIFVTSEIQFQSKIEQVKTNINKIEQTQKPQEKTVLIKEQQIVEAVDKEVSKVIIECDYCSYKMKGNQIVIVKIQKETNKLLCPMCAPKDQETKLFGAMRCNDLKKYFETPNNIRVLAFLTKEGVLTPEGMEEVCGKTIVNKGKKAQTISQWQQSNKFKEFKKLIYKKSLENMNFNEQDHQKICMKMRKFIDEQFKSEDLSEKNIEEYTSKVENFLWS